MSEQFPNNPKQNTDSNSGQDKYRDYELITAFIDNEISDKDELNRIKSLIENDADLSNRYIFEKFTKDTFRDRLKRIETPVYVYKNIGQAISDYQSDCIKLNRQKNNSNSQYQSQGSAQKSNFKKYFGYSAFAFVILVGLAFLLNNFLGRSGDIGENDLVAVSRGIFEKVKQGKVNLDHKTSNAKELTDSMNKHVDFKVFIPDVKGAVLIGGVCNEINGEMTVHFVYQKGNVLIYTMEANLNHLLNSEKIVLADKYKQDITDGKNWFPCMKDTTKPAMVWVKDNVICSSVAEIDPLEIKATLTNLK